MAGHGHGHAHDSSHDHAHPHGGDRARARYVHHAAPRMAIDVALLSTEGGEAALEQIAEALDERGHRVAQREVVDAEALRDALRRAASAGANVALVVLGHRPSARPSLAQELQRRFARPIPGFAEIFRMLAFQEIGPAAFHAEAAAGFSDEGLLVFAFPASAAACRLALSRLILPELPHLLRGEG